MLESLLQQLGSSDPEMKKQAAEKLGELKDSSAVAPLIEALKDRNCDVQRAAAVALGKIGDVQAVEPLSFALVGDAPSLRISAAEALGQIGGTRSAEMLMVALMDDDKSVQVSALKALKETGYEQVLIAALRDGDMYVRREAVGVLGKIGDARAVEPLIAALRDGDIYVRRDAVEALTKIGKASVEPLITALNDGYEEVRMGAAKALEKIGDARAIESLAKFLIAECCFASTQGNWRWFSIMIKPLERLLGNIAANIETEDLRRIATLKDNYEPGEYRVGCAPGIGHSVGSYTPPSGVDCSQVRQLARQELIRRGLEA
jgi:HEAT repeat protein